MQRWPTRLPLILGCFLIAAGWAAIFIGWQQAGRQRLEVGQLPYLLSGGFGGLGLLVLGSVGLLLDALLRVVSEQHRTAERIEAALSRTSSEIQDGLQELRPPPPPVEEPEEDDAGEQTPNRRTPKRRTTRSRSTP